MKKNKQRQLRVIGNSLCLVVHFLTFAENKAEAAKKEEKKAKKKGEEKKRRHKGTYYFTVKD